MTARVLTVREVADLYRCSTDTIRRSIAAGELPAVRVMGVTRIPVSALPATLTQPHDSLAPALSAESHGSATVVDSADSGAAGASPGKSGLPAASTTRRKATRTGVALHDNAG